ncbi:transporter, major facilitator family protein [Necator americanus]|uniref:Transporter, major facilitator family protein n=1 Tax=Necator americanus TaxID=51031 RepID=W2SKB7_NECAM|nr:transporter, major facilitator family protein [Necator americanus]ETN70003.1 transporter, major facilitator family protein [Necator americanus]
MKKKRRQAKFDGRNAKHLLTQTSKIGHELTAWPSCFFKVGDFGPYQILFFFIICLPASLPSAFSAFNQPFVVGSPPHHCRLPYDRDDLRPKTDDQKVLSCFQYNQTEMDFYRSFTSAPIDSYRDHISLIPCQMGWEYDNTTFIDSLVTEFNLVCDHQNWVEISTTSFYVGSFIGNFLFGYIADKFGRRRSFFIILANLVVFGTINAFVKDVKSFIIIRFLTGLPFPALFQIPFIICMEFMGKSGRIFSGLMISLFFGAAMALLGVVAMFIRRWRQLTFFCNAPFAVLFCYYFFLPESPRWLVSANKWEEAKVQLQRIARINGKQDSVNVEELLEILKVNQHLSVEDSKRSHNVSDLFRTPNLRKKTMLVTYIWIMNAIIYNGLTLNVSNLPVDDYWSFIINGAVELPAYFIVWPLLQTVGRRWTLASTMIVCGIGCVSAMFVPSNYPWLVASASFVGKFGVGAGFAVIYIFAGELYPTVVRAIGMGMSSMVAGSGLLLAPHIVKLGDYMKILPLLIMGLMALSAGICTFFLPETLGAPLPMTLEDAENFGKRSFA